MAEPQADLDGDLRLAGELVTEAGRLAQRMRASGVQGLEQKTAIADVVTAADRAAEAYVADRLAAERPDDGVLGEEGASRESRSGRTWVIDPVDGTYNFVAGLTWWCSAIALVEGDELLLGAVYHPHDDVLFAGGPDLPTRRNGVPLPPIEDRSLSHACVTTYLPPAAMRGPVGEAFSRATAGAAAIRMLGSGSMDMTAIAQGELHAFCQRRVPPWDRLPGEALVRGVGGVATSVEAAGDVWTLIGAPRVVAEIRSALEAG